MTFSHASPLQDLINEIQQELSGRDFSGEIRTDLTTRLLYSTDASIYQIEPLGVAFPRRLDDLALIVELCDGFGVPVLARGAGSSLAGQAIGESLIIDCSRYLNQLVEIDPESLTATVEPGLILNSLNWAAAKYGLGFGPDPASAERATLGGSIANNASGAHSILYGMAADHLLSADVVLADGSLATFEPQKLEAIHRQFESPYDNARQTGHPDSILQNWYRAALHIREHFAGAIRENWPRTWRRASGYNLNYLLPWSPSRPPQWDAANSRWGEANENHVAPYPPILADTINLTPLLAGSEGTLAIIRRMKVRLVPLPQHTILGVMTFQSIGAACEAVPAILERGPSAVELIPQSLIRMARSVPAYAQQLSFVQGDPAALLVVEFSGDQLTNLRQQVEALGEGVLIAETSKQQSQVWGVRKVGLGIIQSRPGDLKPVAFIEDLSVPVERLGEFVREIDRILDDYGTSAEMYAHASAGCLHIRPLLNLKTIRGVAALREIAERAVDLTLKMGGSVSGEHGDGLARSEWLERMFGSEILNAFKLLKAAADPKGLLNPGKIVTTGTRGEIPAMDMNLRYGPAYNTRIWPTSLDFSQQSGLAAAVEQCNGAGVCRKAEGVMCPSFQATQEEMHNTRGRANLLRAMLTGLFPSTEQAEKTVYEALDLCLACKGCKAECPSAVDMAKLKYEFTNHYYSHHRRKIRDYLFAYIDLMAWVGHPFVFLVNPALRNPVFAKVIERLVGITHRRKLPKLIRRSFRSQASQLRFSPTSSPEQVLFLSDAFTEFFYPQTGISALRVLDAAGCQVNILPVIGAGRTLISKGFLEPARRHAARLLETIYRLDPEGRLPVVGVEPSEIYTLRDEYLDLFPGDERAERLAMRAFMIDEYLIRPGSSGHPRVDHAIRTAQSTNLEPPLILLHGHCYQKAQPPAADGYPIGVAASVSMLEAAGYRVKVIESGCCGMAGAFGYEAEHYELSMSIGELHLFPLLRKVERNVIIAASGFSCQAQIEDGTRKAARHPITLISDRQQVETSGIGLHT